MVSNECIQLIKFGFQLSNLDKDQASEIAFSLPAVTHKEKLQSSREQDVSINSH